MKSILLSAAFAATACLACSAALAAPPASTYSQPQTREHLSTGVVESYSPRTHRLLLKSGLGYKVADGAAPAHLRNGDRVELRWTAHGEFRTADEVMLRK